MTHPNDREILNLWYSALDEPVGKVISTNDRSFLRNRLYSLRKGANDPKLKCLGIVFPENPNELWIVRHENE